MLTIGRASNTIEPGGEDCALRKHSSLGFLSPEHYEKGSSIRQEPELIFMSIISGETQQIVIPVMHLPIKMRIALF
ncbi:hypothetical protein GXP67_11515 [Rhodocytophaga rosea]|uniref:Uncharacterized protein n=1 Tax=Rhodocytophaga rosea TaxID=2704465 RepID=A0A6C0GHD1_9BACT|nr:hypothetical protein [Rhodocytophaga rosea]QHT67224.1 hypothetical protein GXP67_11515 [Rhodocytophaga rosea]